jgi:hypothetical protein
LLELLLLPEGLALLLFVEVLVVAGVLVFVEGLLVLVAGALLE